MRFDSTLFYHVGEPYAWEALIDEMRGMVQLFDQGGFTGMWLAEHHFAWDGWYRASPNPILLGADLAKVSERLRIGQCGTIIPDWHPIRVAEDIALLDQFTKGRVDFGVARGINSRASAQFNLNADRRNQQRNRDFFEESLDVILKAWTEEAFQYSGQFYAFPTPGWKEANPMVHDSRYHAEDGELIALGVFPKPYQKPHPPVWQMAESVGSHESCARRGIGTMCQQISPAKIKQLWTAYSDVASEVRGQHVPLGEGLAVMRSTFVADTMEEAIKGAREGANLLGAWSSSNPHRARAAEVTEEDLTAQDMELDWFDFQLKHDIILVGTPDSVSEQIERLQSKVNCQHLALFLNFPGLTLDQTMHSLDLFAERVIPRFDSA